MKWKKRQNVKTLWRAIRRQIWSFDWQFWFVDWWRVGDWNGMLNQRSVSGSSHGGLGAGLGWQNQRKQLCGFDGIWPCQIGLDSNWCCLLLSNIGIALLLWIRCSGLNLDPLGEGLCVGWSQEQIMHLIGFGQASPCSFAPYLRRHLFHNGSWRGHVVGIWSSAWSSIGI